MKLTVLSISTILLLTPVFAFAQDLETSYQSLRDAEAKNDAALVKKLAAETVALARKMSAEPAPPAGEDKEGWLSRVSYGRTAEDYSEYALYAVAAKSAPAVTIELLTALEAQNPKSKYLDRGYANYLYALGQTGATAKIPAMAEKALANFPENEDLLSVMADHCMSTKQTDRALGYANRMVNAMVGHAKPEGVAAGDWEKKRSNMLMRGYWMAGVISGEKNLYSAADKNLRAALPLIQGNNAMLAPALFYLGVSNYNLGKATLNKAKVLEGAKFSDQCAAIQSGYAEQAWKNANIMKADAAKMR